MGKTVRVNFTSSELFTALQDDTVEYVVQTTNAPEDLHQQIADKINDLDFEVDGDKSTVTLKP